VAVVFTTTAKLHYYDIVTYLLDHWYLDILARFQKSLLDKIRRLQDHPDIGIKSSKYSKFRRTLINNHYILIYSTSSGKIIIHKLKHKKRE
jgi:plasmid stabilization system protein ParE